MSRIKLDRIEALFKRQNRSLLLSLFMRIFGLGLNGLILLYLAYWLPEGSFAYYATWLAFVTIVSNLGALGLQHRLLDYSMSGVKCGSVSNWHAFGALVAVALSCIGAALWSLISLTLDYSVPCTLLAILIQGFISLRSSELIRLDRIISAQAPEHFYRPLLLAVFYLVAVESGAISSSLQVLFIYVSGSFLALVIGGTPLCAIVAGVYHNKFRLPGPRGISNFLRSSLSQSIQINSEQFLILIVGLTQTAVVSTAFRLISLAVQFLQVLGHGAQLYFQRELSTSLHEKKSLQKFFMIYRKVRVFMIVGFVISILMALLGYYTFTHLLIVLPVFVHPTPQALVLVCSISFLVASGPMTLALERAGYSSIISLTYGFALLVFVGFLTALNLTVDWLMVIYAGYFLLVTLSFRGSLRCRIVVG